LKDRGEQMKYLNLASAIVVSLALTSCTKPIEPPNLMTAAQHQSGVIEGSGTAGFAGITDRIAALPQDVYAGTDYHIAEAINNQGGPSKGIKVVLRGAALSYMSSPKDAFVDSSQTQNGSTTELGHEELQFTEDAAGGLVATAKNLPYQRDLRLLMTMTGLQNGDGDLQIFIYPLDKKGKTNASFTKRLRCLSETDQRVNEDHSLDVPE
jgi:hypothetical protein